MMTRSQRKKLTAHVSNTITSSDTTLTNNASLTTSNTAEISKDSTGDALQSCIKLRINDMWFRSTCPPSLQNRIF